MAWRIWPQTWPNGREYWTVEDRASTPPRARVGAAGAVSKFYEKAQAEAEAERLRSKDKEATAWQA